MSNSTGISLKSRAVSYLSRREHSKVELRQKLQAHAQDANEIEELLYDLEQGNWQSDERFAHSLANRRMPRYGWLKLQHELQQHQISETVINDLKQIFQSNEFDRALLVWQKKFNEKPQDQKQYAKQYRFMMGRGFASNIVHAVINSDQNS